MKIKSETSKYISMGIIAIFFVGFVYLTAKAIQISSKTQIGVDDGIYTNTVKTSKEISAKAFELSKECRSELCKVQSLLDYVTHIPYKINHFRAKSPQATIQKNFGDCDDKSNLLISMLYALKIESYFVLVPKHIFVIVKIEDKKLHHVKGLWVDGKKYFILEGTAEGSKVGFPLKYNFDEIHAIVEPFSNEKLPYEKLEYKISNKN